MLVRPLHEENAELPTLVTLSGIVKLVRLVHQKNASSPMRMTVFGIVTAVRSFQKVKAYLARLPQSANDESPMIVMLSGIETLTRRHPKNVFAGIVVRPDPISTLVIADLENT